MLTFFFLIDFAETAVRSCSANVLQTGVFKNLGKLTGKHLWWSLNFNEFANLQSATLSIIIDTATIVFL